VCESSPGKAVKKNPTNGRDIQLIELVINSNKLNFLSLFGFWNSSNIITSTIEIIMLSKQNFITVSANGNWSNNVGANIPLIGRDKSNTILPIAHKR
jgi:hypothetical protein